jgi:hypothetical protein
MKDLTYTHEKHILVHPRLDIGSINMFYRNSYRTVITVQNSVILQLLTTSITNIIPMTWTEYFRCSEFKLSS